MKTIHNNPLFTDITPEEEVSVQGGNPFIIEALKKAAKLGLPSLVKAAINKVASKWLTESGNGLIFGDKKGTKDDTIRLGVGIANEVDVPGSNKYGILNNGKWITF